MIHTLARSHAPAGLQMIRSIQVQNYRCFDDLRIEDCRRLNVIVGDNGSGKTALLESIFFTLAAGIEVGRRFRAQRGFSQTISGTSIQIEEVMWRGFFRNNDFSKIIRINLDGDGPDDRSLAIIRGDQDENLPLDLAPAGKIRFIWKNASGREIERVPSLSNAGTLQLPDTGEDLPNFHHFGANQTISAADVAGRFSVLSQARKQDEFTKVFSEEYDWIEDLNIEVQGGSPVLFATLEAIQQKRPLPDISGGLNRIAAIMVTLAATRQGCVTVDEIENGIFHIHYSAIWRGLLAFLRKSEGQMFATTHSKECLDGLIDAAGDQVDDIALWRVERDGDKSIVHQFSGATLKRGVEYGTEVRGGGGEE